MTPEQARNKLANSGFDATLLISGLGAGLISKYTGAGDFTGNMFRPNSKMGSWFASVAKDTGVETVEETLQSGVGAFGKNVGVKLYADENQEVLEDTGSTAGAGATGGALSGGAMSTVTSTAKVAGEAAVEKRKKYEEKLAKEQFNKDVVDSVAQSGNVAVVLNQEDENYNLRTSIEAINARSKNGDATPEELQSNKDEANKLLDDASREEQRLIAERKKLPKGRKRTKLNKEIEALSQDIEAAEALYAQVNESVTLKDDAVEKAIDEGASERVLNSLRNSPDSVSVDQAQRMLGSSSVSLTDTQTQELQDHITVQKAVKSVEEVNGDVLIGNVEDGFLGLQQYQERVSAAVNRGDKEGAENALKGLRKFAERHTAKALAFRKALSNKKEDIDALKETYGNNVYSKPELAHTIATEATALSAGVRQAENRIASLGAPAAPVSDSAPATPQQDQADVVVETEVTEADTGIAEATPEQAQEQSSGSTDSTATRSSDESPTPTTIPVPTIESDVASTTAQDKADVAAPDSAATSTPKGTYDTGNETLNKLMEENPDNSIVSNIKAKLNAGGSIGPKLAVTLINGLAPAGQYTAGGTTSKIPKNKSTDAIRLKRRKKTSIPKPKKSTKPIQPDDELLVAMRKLGGVNIEEAEAQGIDRADWRGKKGARSAFAIEGLSFDAMAEALGEEGYLGDDITPNNLLNLIVESLFDRPQYATDGAGIVLAEKVIDDKKLEDQANAEGFGPDSWKDTGNAQLNQLMDENPDHPSVDRILDRIQEGNVITNEQAEVLIKQFTGNDPAKSDAPEKIEGYNLGTELTGKVVESKATNIKELVEEFYETNNVQQHFEAVPGDGNILTTENDFFDRVDMDLVAPALDQPGGVTTDQLNLLKGLAHTNRRMTKAFKELFLRKEVEFRHDDYIQYLVNESDGTMDSNVVGAITVAVAEWVQSKGTKSLFNDKASINGILGQRSDTDLPYEAYGLLGDVGQSRPSLVNELGGSIVRALGIRAKNTAPGNMQSNLESSMGAMAIAMMLDAGVIVEGGRIPVGDIAALKGKNANPTFADNERSEAIFYKAVSEENSEGKSSLTGWVSDLARAGKAEKEGMISKLFSVKKSETGPVWSKPKRVVNKQKGIKGAAMKVAKEVQDILKIHQNRGVTMKTREIALFESLTEEQQLTMMGYVHDLSGKHITKIPGIEGKNAAIIRERDHLLNQVEESRSRDNAPFYFEHEIWKNGRIGMVSNTFNMQGSTTHRHFAKMSNWEQEIDLFDPESMSAFYLSLAEPFGIKHDGQSRDKTIREVKAKIDSDEIRAATDAINSMDSDAAPETLVANQLAIMNAVGKSGAYGLDALSNLAAMREAEDNSADSFTSNLFHEVDGVTNGPAIGTLQLYAGGTHADVQRKLQRTGMMFDHSYNGFGEWREKSGELDSYQDIAKTWGAKFKDFIAEQKNQLVRNRFIAVEALLGALTKEKDGETVVTSDGRNLAKPSLMTTTYGAGDKSVAESTGQAFLDKYYDRIEKAVEDDDFDALALVENQINTILNGSGVELVNLHNGNPLGTALTNKQEEFVRKIIETSLGKVLVETIDEGFNDFKDKGALINNTMGAVFDIFETMFNDRIAKRTEELKAEGKIITREGKNGEIALTTIPKEEINKIMTELLEAQPILNNFFSQRSGNTDEGIFVAKTEQQRTNSAAHITRQNYAKPVAGFNSSLAQGTETVFTDPGVSSTVLAVQSVDAATMLQEMRDHILLNVHDAIIVNAQSAINDGRDMNKNYTDVMSEFSIMTAASDALQRATEFMYQQDEANGTKLASQARLKIEARLEKANKKAKDPSAPIDVDDLKDHVSRTATVVDTGKDRTMSEAVSQAQYFIADGDLVFDKDTNLSAETAQERTVEAILDDAGDDIRSLHEIEGRLLGSSQESINTDDFQSETDRRISSMNSLELFDELGNKANSATVEDPTHREFLRTMLEEDINPVLEAFDYHYKTSVSSETIGATTGLDMYIINQVTGQVPDQSSMLANGIRMSAQEVYLHELSHNISRAGIDNSNKLAVRQLKRLWADTKSVTEISDFMSNPDLPKSDPTYAVEYEAAKIRYDHIFNVKTNADGTADYLHEFVAFGRTNAKFRAKLSTITIKVPSSLREAFSQEGTLLERLAQVFEFALATINGWLGKSEVLTADKKLDRLFMNLSNIRRRSEQPVIRHAETALIGASKAMSSIAHHALIQGRKLNNTPVIGKLVAVPVFGLTLAQHWNSKSMKKFIEPLKKSILERRKRKRNLASSLANEALSRTSDNGRFHDLNRMANKQVDQGRKHMDGATARYVIAQFKTEPTDKQKVAITKALLKTDLVSLSNLTLEQLEDTVRVGGTLDAQISALENQLNQTGVLRHYYRRSANSLGHYMAAGRHLEVNGMMNATQIADLTGTGVTPPASNKLSDYSGIIDQLATLYSLRYTAHDDRNQLADLINTERLRGDHNGILATLAMHRELKKDAESKLFAGSTNHVKGYTKEIIDPNVSVKYATKLEEKELKQQGYVRSKRPIARDANDPLQVDMYQYVNNNGGMATFLAGILSLTGKRAKGSDTINNRVQAGDPLSNVNGSLDIKSITDEKKDAIKDMFTNKRITPKNSNKNLMVPVTNSQRKITGWRYVMTEQSKDDVLNKQNNFEDVMGAMASSIVDKVESKKINDQLIEALKMQYDEDFNPDHYVRVGPLSTDPRLRDIYNMMPYETRSKIKSVWGGNNMWVRNDIVDQTLGYRKASITDVYQMNPEDYAGLKKLALEMVQKIFSFIPPNRLAQAENIWQEVIKFVKDVVVIKMGVVTVANTLSNAVSLLMKGVSIRDAVKYQIEGFSAAIAYERDRRELFEKENDLKLGQSSNRARDAERVAQLKNDLATNPVKELIDAGVFQTIIEDIEDNKGNFTFASKADNWFQGTSVGSKVSKTLDSKGGSRVIKAAREVFMMHGSKTYTMFNQAAQYSDFIARYALYKHQTSRKVNPLSKKDSISDIVSTFIDYDVPTHKALQYGNDMGFIMFSKYSLRVQRVILGAFADDPARVMSIMAAQAMLGDVPDMIDGSYILGEGNPFNVVRDPLDHLSTIMDSDIATLTAVGL